MALGDCSILKLHGSRRPHPDARMSRTLMPWATRCQAGVAYLTAFEAIKVSSPCGYSVHVPAQMRDPDALARSWNGHADRRAAFSRTTSAVDLKFLSL